MNKRELGAALLKEMDVLNDYVNAFEKKGLVTWSADPYGFAYYVDETTAMAAEVQRMEAEYNQTVYAIVCGRYDVGGEVMDATTYLFVDDDDLKLAERNLKAGNPVWKDIITPHSAQYGYVAKARVVGFFDEIGDVCVKGRLGGLARTI